MYVSDATCLGYIRWTIFRAPDHNQGSGFVQHGAFDSNSVAADALQA